MWHMEAVHISRQLDRGGIKGPDFAHNQLTHETIFINIQMRHKH